MIFFKLAKIPFKVLHVSVILVVSSATKPGKEFYHFSACGVDKVLKPDYRYKELRAFTPLHCGILCGSDPDCKSFDYDQALSRCYLGSVKVGRSDCQHLVDDLDSEAQHYAEGPQCFDGKEPQPDKTCRCPVAFGGPGCRTRMEDCSDWTDFFEDPVVLWIWPNNTEQPFQVFCTKISKNVRMVLMNRETGDVDFNRRWNEYRDGFGNLTGDHWLGLHYMHRLTQNKRYKLRFSIKLGNETDNAHYMTHNDARIDDESNDYTLHAEASKNFGGPIVDCLYPDLVDTPFSTRDRDNDGDDTVACSKTFGAGWWFNGTAGCAACNPTGRMPYPFLGGREGGNDELFWNNTVDHLLSLTIMVYLLPY